VHFRIYVRCKLLINTSTLTLTSLTQTQSSRKPTMDTKFCALLLTCVIRRPVFGSSIQCQCHKVGVSISLYAVRPISRGGSVAEWLACWTQALKGPGSNRSRDAVGNSLRQTVHTHRAPVHQAAKSVAAFLRVARVTAGLAESNGSQPPGL